MSWNRWTTKRDLLRAVGQAGLVAGSAGLSRVALPTIGGLTGVAAMELLFQREAMAADAKLSALATGTVPDFYYGIESNTSKKYNDNKILNVVNFGADPTGLSDSSPGIQACFNAAFGTTASPHGAAPGVYSNRPVYFPPGHYRCDTTLTLRSVQGGWIFGAGVNTTTLYYNGSVPGGVTTTSLIHTNGFAYSRIENMTLVIGGDNTVALNLDWDNTGSVALNANTFVDLLIQGAGSGASTATTGILIGATGFMGSEMTFIRASITLCSNGLLTANSNALNITILGGGASECDIGFSANQGSIGVILGGSYANNTTADVLNGNGCSMHLIGGRTESLNYYLDNNGSYSVISGVQQNGAYSLSGNFVNAAGDTTVEGCRSDFGVLRGAGKLVINGSSFARLDYLDNFTGTATINNSVYGSGNNQLIEVYSQKKVGSAIRTYGIEATALTDASFLYASPNPQNFTVTIASPGVFTTAFIHLLQAGYPLVFTTTGALPTGLSLNTVYFVIATGLTANNFRVSTTLGGSAVNTSGSQSGTHSYVVPRLYAVGDQILKSNVAAGGSPGWSVVTAGYSVAIAAAGVKAQAAVAA